MGPMTTYKSGGSAKLFAEVGSVSELRNLISSGITRSEQVLVLGRGSNLVVADAGYDGLVIRLGGEFTKHHFEDHQLVAGGAVPLPRLARASVATGLSGLEFFVGVPGSVGGAVRQNAGCFGAETADVLVTADLVDVRSGVERSADRETLEMGYRHSNVGPSEVVVWARFVGAPDVSGQGGEKIRRITRWRKENQPGGSFNAGSVFKNPEGLTAGELIDGLGLKGLSVGGVSVSSKHANFFVADSTATSADILALVESVKSRVFEQTGTMLEPEIQFVGFEDDN